MKNKLFLTLSLFLLAGLLDGLGARGAHQKYYLGEGEPHEVCAEIPCAGGPG